MTEHLARLRPHATRQRAATWDRTGRNDDFVRVAPGETVLLARGQGPGQITHLWFTVRSPDLWWGRTLVLRAFWDGASTPSVEVPLGDFFGAGNCRTATFTSALLEGAPRDGRSLHSWFPMPYATGFVLTVTNDGTLPVTALYAHVDYESWESEDPSLGRFHAWWNHERRTRAPEPDGTYVPAINDTGLHNYLLVETEGRGHYLGAFLFAQSDEGGWYGEGDDVVFLDGKPWCDALHGTGTEDWAGTAWSPAVAFSHPYYGQPIAEREDWAGFNSLYRLHVVDPLPFRTSLRATLEHGHNNDRADDWSSVAYWYQHDRGRPLPELPPMESRDPAWPAAWRERALAVRHAYLSAFASGDSALLSRYTTGIGYLAEAVHRWDGEAVDRALGWLTGRVPPAAPGVVPARGPLAGLVGAPDSSVRAWVEARSAVEVLSAVAMDWSARFDAIESGRTALCVGLLLADGSARRQLVIGNGSCGVRVESTGPERLTLSADPLTLVQWSLGVLDPWEAVLTGALVIEGDGNLAFRLPALFPHYGATA